MPSIVIPKALKQGDTIAFISPSARLNDQFPAVVSRATEVLQSQGYKVRTFFTPDTDIQSSIANRLKEIRSAFLDPTISAVICTIGGTTFTELLPSLLADAELQDAIKADPKIVVGYSDITGLHWFLHALTGLRTFYGPGAIAELGAPESVDDESNPLAFCVRHLFRVITNAHQPVGDIARSSIYAPEAAEIFKTGQYPSKPQDVSPTSGWTWLRRGKARGRLFGGCLTVVARLNGVRQIAPDWRGRIVFLETAAADDLEGPPLDRVRAGFADMIAQGVFDQAAGLVVGRPYGYDIDQQLKEYTGIIKGLLCEGSIIKEEFPILFGVDFGHTTPMVTLPFDALAEMDSEADRFAVLEAGVV